MAGIFGTYNISGLVAALPAANASRGLLSAARATDRQSAGSVRSPEDNAALRRAQQAENTARNLGRVRVGLKNAVRAVEKAQDTIKEVQSLVREMHKVIELAQKPGADEDEKRAQAQRFDQLLGKINSKLRYSTSNGVNLVGNRIRDVFQTDTMPIRTRPDAPKVRTLEGTYMVSEYYVEDAGGNRFFPDIYGSQVNQFPEPEGGNSVIVSDDDAVSFDHDTGAFSITKSGDADPVLEGTVHRKGLGMLHSAFYGSFLDDASLEQAKADVSTALGKLRTQVGVYEGHHTSVQADLDRIESAITENRNIALSLKTDQLVENRREALEARRGQQLFQATLQVSVLGGGSELNVLSASMNGSGGILGLKGSLYDDEA